MNIFKHYIFLHQFLFAKAYIFSKSFLREKNNPQFYATRIAGFPSVILAFDLYSFLLLLFPNKTQGSWYYIKFIIILTVLSITIDYFMLKGKEYTTLVEDIKKLSKSENKKWKIIAWCYILVLLAIALGFILD